VFWLSVFQKVWGIKVNKPHFLRNNIGLLALPLPAARPNKQSVPAQVWFVDLGTLKAYT
jgi:hypothetical protein